MKILPLPKANQNAPENRQFAPKRKDRIETTNFQVLCVYIYIRLFQEAYKL